MMEFGGLVVVVGRDLDAVYLQRGLRVRVQAHGSGVAFGVDPLPAFPQHYVYLYVHQQGDNEGDVEGDDRGIHNKGRVGNDTLILLWKTQEIAGAWS